MSDCDLSLFVQVGEEWAAVIDAEVEYAMLVGGFEGGAEDGGVGGLLEGCEVEAVKGGEHGEF